MLCTLCLAQDTSLLESTTGTLAISMTSKIDTTTISMAEIATTTSLMNGMKFTYLFVQKLQVLGT